MRTSLAAIFSLSTNNNNNNLIKSTIFTLDVAPLFTLLEAEHEQRAAAAAWRKRDFS
jgi:hypothetical protein